MAEEKSINLIKDVRPGFKNVNLVFIVLDVSKPTKTKDGNDIRTIRVADKSGSVNMSVWNDQGAQMLPGDIIRCIRGYTQVWKNQLTLYVGKVGGMEKIGEFCMLFSETPNMSEPNPEFMAMAKQISDKREAHLPGVNPPPPPPPPPGISSSHTISTPSNNSKLGNGTAKFHPYQRSNSMDNKNDPRLLRRSASDSGGFKASPMDPRQRAAAPQLPPVTSQQQPKPPQVNLNRDPRRR